MLLLLSGREWGLLLGGRLAVRTVHELERERGRRGGGLRCDGGKLHVERHDLQQHVRVRLQDH